MVPDTRQRRDRRRRIVVLYDVGSASPREISNGVAGVADPVFVVGGSAHARDMVPVLSALGPVVLATDVARTAAEVRGHGPTDGVITFSERMLRPGSELAAALGHRFHDRETVLRLTDKNEQRRALAASAATAVRSCRVSAPSEVDAALAVVGLPAVLKPTVGEGSRDTHPIEGAEQARAILAGLSSGTGPVSFQLEQLLVGRPSWPFGDYVSVESLTVDGRPRHVAVTGKFALAPPFREPGQFWPAPLDPVDDGLVRSLTSSALAALGVVNGLTHTEIKLTPDGPRIIEVNGRIGGFVSDLARRCLGRDLIELAALVAMGEPVDWPPEVGPHPVYYQYSNLAPPDAVGLRPVEGLPQVRRTPGVTAYRQLVRPPCGLTAGVATQELDLMCGTAQDFDEMFRTVEDAIGRLMFEFVLPDGAIRALRGTQLPSATALPQVPFTLKET
jgi:hypothetical protein